MMLRLILIFYIKIITINGQSEDQNLESLIAEIFPTYEPYKVFSPCEKGIVKMNRLFLQENYWNGIIDVNKDYPNLTEAFIVLRLKAAAILTVDPQEGSVLLSDDQIKVVRFFRPADGYENLKFKVQGRPKEKFPNVLSLKLNNDDLCNNPQEWIPSMELNNTNTEIIEDNAGTNFDNTSNRESSETCGQRKILLEGLITNGYASIEGYWPWHAALIHLKGNIYEYVCGGTLLNSNTIITAAHCVTEYGHAMTPARISVILGLHDRLLAGQNVQNFRAYKVIPHEEFNPANYKNDIALILLATEVKFTSYVQPICLWSKDQADLQNVVNENGIVVGWGFTEKKNEASEILNQAKMPIVDTFTCLKSNRKFFGAVISEKNFCAGFKNGTGVCNGDSGGGMSFLRDNVYKIRGIVSSGPIGDNENVCNSHEYILFTDVAKYLDWIENQIVKYN